MCQWLYGIYESQTHPRRRQRTAPVPRGTVALSRGHRDAIFEPERGPSPGVSLMSSPRAAQPMACFRPSITSFTGGVVPDVVVLNHLSREASAMVFGAYPYIVFRATRGQATRSAIIECIAATELSVPGIRRTFAVTFRRLFLKGRFNVAWEPCAYPLNLLFMCLAACLHGDASTPGFNPTARAYWSLFRSQMSDLKLSTARSSPSFPI